MALSEELQQASLIINEQVELNLNGTKSRHGELGPAILELEIVISQLLEFWADCIQHEGSRIFEFWADCIQRTANPLILGIFYVLYILSIQFWALPTIRGSIKKPSAYFGCNK